MEAMSQGMPSPRKTFTALEPVTLPTAASANSSLRIASLLANVSGREVPTATKVMAVIASPRPITQPKSEEISPTTAVQAPMKQMETKKAGQPLAQLTGGTSANCNFQKRVTECISESKAEGGSSSPVSSSMPPESTSASVNLCAQLPVPLRLSESASCLRTRERTRLIFSRQLSSSRMETVHTLSPDSTPSSSHDRSTKKCSVSSKASSSTMCTCTLIELTPGRKVTVPCACL
mmetsp:Transcript_18943/g.48275  ORF Transcript_18943/g.48275 Transcript_18943/m.48275 type:complete len:234 (+) Transcript_18943:231-932(+)